MLQFQPFANPDELKSRIGRLFDGMELSWSPLPETQGQRPEWVVGSYQDANGKTRGLACKARVNREGIDLRCDETMLQAVQAEALRLGFGGVDVFGEFTTPTPAPLLHQGVRCCGLSEFEQAVMKYLSAGPVADSVENRNALRDRLHDVTTLLQKGDIDLDAYREAMARLALTLPQHKTAAPQKRNHLGPWLEDRPAVASDQANVVSEEISVMRSVSPKNIAPDDSRIQQARALQDLLWKETLRNQDPKQRASMAATLINSHSCRSDLQEILDAACGTYSRIYDFHELCAMAMRSDKAEDLLPILLRYNGGAAGLPSSLIVDAFEARRWQAGIDLLEQDFEPGASSARASAEAVILGDGWPSALQALLQRDLDPNARATSVPGVSLFELAHRHSRADLAKALVLAGADRYAPWSNGHMGADFYAPAELKLGPVIKDQAMFDRQKAWAARAGRPVFSPGTISLVPGRKPGQGRGLD